MYRNDRFLVDNFRCLVYNLPMFCSSHPQGKGLEHLVEMSASCTPNIKTSPPKESSLFLYS